MRHPEKFDFRLLIGAGHCGPLPPLVLRLDRVKTKENEMTYQTRNKSTAYANNAHVMCKRLLRN